LNRHFFILFLLSSFSMRKKVYGQSQTKACPFCGKLATTKNSQGVETCIDHKSKSMDGMVCSCGSVLQPKEGKYGAFFLCFNCGPISMKKALEMNSGGNGYKVQTQKKDKKDEDNKAARDFIAREMNKGLPSVDDL